MKRVCLTPEFVNEIEPPERGEIWISDSHVRYFGLRVWSGKRSGGKAFSIRLRDRFGVVVREAYNPERDYSLYGWGEESDKPLGYYLSDARKWAKDRIAYHLGLPTSSDRQRQRWERRRRTILATRIGDAINRKIAHLQRTSNDHVYVHHIKTMISANVSDDIMESTFKNVHICNLADNISNRSISYGNVKVLRAFIAGVFKDAASSYGVLNYKLESVQRRCHKNLSNRKSPPHPKILNITDDEYGKFFELLEQDKHWRQSLALRLYFATEARLQPVLRARWSDIIGKTWYPFTPKERALWQGSKQRLGTDALRVLRQIERCHHAENINSPYLFPSSNDALKPIKTVQRHWKRWNDILGWHSLPLSHVVLGHKGRANPSYSSFFYSYFLEFDRPQSVREVSKVAKRRQDKSINATTYR